MVIRTTAIGCRTINLSVLLYFQRVEKYRPATLNDLISHEEIIATSKFLPILGLVQLSNSIFMIPVNNFIKQDQLPHLLFYGPPGKFVSEEVD